MHKQMRWLSFYNPLKAQYYSTILHRAGHIESQPQPVLQDTEQRVWARCSRMQSMAMANDEYLYVAMTLYL